MKQLFRNNGFVPIAAFVLLLATLACTCTSSLPFGNDEESGDGDVTAEESTSEESTTEESVSESTGSDVTYVTITSDEAGISMSYPSSWYVEEDFGFSFYSDEALVDSDAVGDGAGVFVSAGFPADLSPAETLDGFYLEGDEFSALEVIQDTTTLTINGNPAAQLMAEGELEGENVRLTITVINSADNSALILAISGINTADDYEAIFAEMAESVILTTPADAFPDLSEDPEPTAEVAVEGPEPTPEGGTGNVGGGHLGGVGPGPSLVLDKVISGATNSSAPIPFTFMARTGRSVVIMTTSPAGDDLTLTIYDPNGSEIAYVDDTFDGAEYYLLDPEMDGNYLAQVAPFSGQGEFIIGMLGLSDNAPGMLLTESGNTGGEAIEYELTAGSDSAFLIYLEPVDDEDVTLTLLDSDGNQVGYADTGFSGEPEAIMYYADGGDFILLVDTFTSGDTEYNVYIAGAPLLGPAPGSGGSPGGGGQAGGGTGDIDGSAIPSTDEFGTVYPVIDGASEFTQLGTGINYSITDRSLAEVAEFYRYQASLLGLTERQVTTIISEDVINLVFDGSDQGALVVQAVPLGSGVVNVNVRFEDI